MKFEEVVKTITPPNKIQKREFLSSGEYPIIDQSQNDIAGYTNDNESVLFIEQPMVIFGDHTCEIKYSDRPFAQGADGIKILETNNLIIPKFLYFYLKSGIITPNGYKRHFSALKEAKLPIVDIDIQERLIQESEEKERIIESNKKIIEIMEEKIEEVLNEI